MENNRLGKGPYWVLAFLLLVGLGISLHLTWHHENSYYGDSQVKLGFCPENAVINCDVVNTSRFSELFGIPIALFAVPTYLFLLLLLALRGRFSQVPLTLMLVGLATSSYSVFLAGISYFKIGYGCLWCMGLYVINFATLLVGILSFKKERALNFNPWASFLRVSIPSFLGLVALSLSAQQGYRVTLKNRFVAQQDLRKRTQADLWKPKGFRFATSFQKPVFKADKQIALESEDLQPLIGNGKPLAIIYQSPGFSQSDEFVHQVLSLLQKRLPEAQTFTVMGLRDSSRIESLVEDHHTKAQTKDIPLLFDLDFANLKTLDLPHNQATLLLIAKDGSLLSNQITDVSRNLKLGVEDISVGDWLNRVAKGQSEVALSQLKAVSNPEAMIGRCAPSFELTNLVNRKSYSFKPQNLKKATLLVFWSATCGHCREELPKLVEYHRKRQKDLDIVSITRIRSQRGAKGPEGAEFALNYAKSIGLTWPILNDSNLVSYLYRVDSTPTSILISPSGTIEKYWKGTVSGLESIYDMAVREVSTSSKKVCQANSPIEKANLDFFFKTADSKRVPSSEILKKPTLVHFWATWCLPCQEELPHFVKFAKEQKMKGIDSVLVTVESPQEKDKVSQFLKPYQWTDPVYFSPFGGVYDKMNTAYSVPRTYLINGKGEVLKKYLGAQDWENELFQELVETWFQNKF